MNKLERSKLKMVNYIKKFNIDELKKFDTDGYNELRKSISKLIKYDCEKITTMVLLSKLDGEPRLTFNFDSKCFSKLIKKSANKMFTLLMGFNWEEDDIDVLKRDMDILNDIFIKNLFKNYIFTNKMHDYNTLLSKSCSIKDILDNIMLQYRIDVDTRQGTIIYFKSHHDLELVQTLVNEYEENLIVNSIYNRLKVNPLLYIDELGNVYFRKKIFKNKNYKLSINVDEFI